MKLYVLKKLAQSTNAQIIYHRAKEIGTFRLFENTADFSQLQIWYLYYLELYTILYQDLQMNEEYISEEVINDDLRCEAYLYYKKINKNKKHNLNAKTAQDSSGGRGSVIFKRK